MKTINSEKKSKHFLEGMLLIFLILCFTFAPAITYIYNKMEFLLYPRHYQEEVEAAAGYYGMEPNLIYAVIKAESGFSESAVSAVGAIGLMQIIPDTFLFDIREQIGMPRKESSSLFDAETNIMAGTYYLTHWYDYFLDVYQIDEPTAEALAAYNAGIGNIWKWLEDDTLSDWDGLFIDRIPFDETRHYVQKVLRYKEKYDALYGTGMMHTGRISENLAYRYAKKYGAEFDVDPRMVLAVIRAESSFNPIEVSSSDAMGLMQITKGTFEDIKQDLFLNENYEDLVDPELNIKCGTYYLSWADERVDGLAQIAATYNAGLTNVNEWLSDPHYSEDSKNLIIENIPIETTRRYVGYVLTYYKEYCIQYPKG